MSKVVSKILPIALTVLGTYIGGPVGGAAGGALGSGVGSAISGNSVGESFGKAALGGITGGLAGGAGSSLTSALGLTGTTLGNTLGGALQGAGIGGLTGGTKGALSGALLGGLGGGVLGGTGEAVSEGINGVQTQISGAGAPMSVPTGGLNSLTGSTSGLAAGGGASALAEGGMNLKDVASLGGTLLSGLSSTDALEEQQRQLLEAQNKAAQLMSPYAEAGQGALGQLSNALTAGFNPSDLTSSQGYQFQLGEGQKALQQQLAAQGLGQSGAAVKAATEYSQGLADKTYQDEFNRWLAQNQQLAGLSNLGATTANNLGDIYGTMGLTGAGVTGATQDALNKMYAGISQSPITEALLRKSGMFA